MQVKNPYTDDQRDAILKQLGPTPGTNTTMPVSPSGMMPTDPIGAITGGPATGAGKPASAIDPFTGFQPKYAMEGFDTGRLQDPNKSAKDAFAYFANQAPPPPIQDKAALGQWFEQYIRPGMDALGHKVSGVNGDSFTYGNHEGNFSVDFGRGAGAEGGALAWQASPSDDETSQRYGTPSTAAPAPSPAMSMGGPTENNDALAQIMEELNAIVRGGPSPTQRNAVLSLLG
jgi:hypothetical protein